MEYYDEVLEVKKKPNIVSPGVSDVVGGVGDDDNEPDIPKANVGQNKSFQMIEDDPLIIQSPPMRPISSLARNSSSNKLPLRKTESYGSETESSDSEPHPQNDSARNQDSKLTIADHKDWDKLNVPNDIKEMFQLILRYSPPKIEIDYVLQPFIPEFIPAVGDIDAFLKVIPPKLPNEKNNLNENLGKLGLIILDEPSGQQSEPALLHMKLRSISTNPRTPALSSSFIGSGGGSGGTSENNNRSSMGSAPPPSISRSSKDIERWIHEIQNLHVNKPFPIVVHRNREMQDIDALMTEWPPEMERCLNMIGLPNAFLDCSLCVYIELICSLLNISIPATKTQADYIFALFTLFNLFLAVKNSVQ